MSLGYIQASREVLKYIDKYLHREADLSIVQFITLMVIYNRLGPVRPSEIARWTQTERHNISTLLNRMERSKLIKVTRDSHDKRYVNITITKKGRDTFTKCIEVSDRFIDQIMHSFTEDDLKKYSILLHTTLMNAASGLGSIDRIKKRKIDQES